MENTSKSNKLKLYATIVYACFFGTSYFTSAQNFNITLGGDKEDAINEIWQQQDGSFMAFGRSATSNNGDVQDTNEGNFDCWFLQIDSTGKLLNSKLFGGNEDDVALSNMVLNDSTFIAIASTKSTFSVNYGDSLDTRRWWDMWVFKLNKKGEVLNQKLLVSKGFNTYDFIVDNFVANNQIVLITGILGFEDRHSNHIYQLDENLNITCTNWLNKDPGNLLYDIEQTPDGGFIGVGSEKVGGDQIPMTPPFPAGFTINRGYITKLNAKKEEVWRQFSDRNVHFYEIELLPDGHFIVAAGAGSIAPAFGDNTESFGDRDIWFLKLDSAGNRVWDKRIGSAEQDFPENLLSLQNGTFLLTGFTVSENDSIPEGYKGGQDILLANFDTNGNILWTNILGGSKDERLTSIQQTKDEGFILLAKSNSSNSGDITQINHGEQDAWVIKLNAQGNIEWQQLIGGSEDDFLYKILPLPNGGYIATGTTYSSNDGDILADNKGESDAWIIKMDENGNFDTRVSTIDIPPTPTYTSYPNPFNEALQIELNLPQQANINLSIYNANGQLIKELANGYYTPGKHLFNWKNNTELQQLASGNYWCTFTSLNNTLSSFTVPLQKR